MPVKTGKEIMNTFCAMLESKPLDSVTVKEIAKECGINRNTFYYHYDSIDSLLEAVFIFEASKLNAVIKNMTAWFEKISAFFDSIKAQKAFMFNVFSSSKREMLTKYITDSIEPVVCEYINSQAIGCTARAEDISSITEIYKFVIVGYMTEWIKGGMERDYHPDLNRLDYLFGGNTRYILKRVGRVE